jgi:hypothetical protein
VPFRSADRVERAARFAADETPFEIGARDNAAWRVTSGSMELVQRTA